MHTEKRGAHVGRARQKEARTSGMAKEAHTSEGGADAYVGREQQNGTRTGGTHSSEDAHGKGGAHGNGGECSIEGAAWHGGCIRPRGTFANPPNDGSRPHSRG
jgi:hypothetical protein